MKIAVKRRELLKSICKAVIGAAISGRQLFGVEPAPAEAGSAKSCRANNLPGVPRVLLASAFGAVGDGETDDGLAVLRMLDALRHANSPVLLQFESDKTYFLATGRDRYAFLIDSATDLTIDGGNSIFLIDSNQRFLTLKHSRRVSVRNMKVEYSPLPFADGTIIAKNKQSSYADVKIDRGVALPPLGGPTHEDGEQDYFGLLWAEGPYSAVGSRYSMRYNFEVEDVREAYPGSLNERIVRVITTSGSDLIDELEINKWRLSVPVRGVAHRYGPGESCSVIDNHDVTFDNVDMWSAPWFAIVIAGNTGSVVFRNTHVRPKPGTSRMSSSARDGYHVSNNSASILIDGCILQGMGDDAFNINVLGCGLRQVISSNTIQIQQNFPLGIPRLSVGDTLVAYHETRGLLLGDAKITATRLMSPGSDKPTASAVYEVDLSRSIPGIEADHTLIWNRTAANPNCVLSRCRVDLSLRLRTPVTISDCEINALAWFTGDDIEAPIPSNVVVRNSTFRLGSGNASIAIITDGPDLQGHRPAEPVILNVLYEGNTIYGDFIMNDAANVHLIGNHFADAAHQIRMTNIRDVRLRDNTYGCRPLTEIADISIGSAKDAEEIVIIGGPDSTRKAW